MSKHTSGPWSFDGPPDNHIVWGPSGEGRICFMAHSAGVDPEGDTANARLIASAPDLLEALEGFISWGTKQCPCENEDPNPCSLCGASVENLETCKAIESKFPRIILAKARAAIAKALGEQA